MFRRILAAFAVTAALAALVGTPSDAFAGRVPGPGKDTTVVSGGSSKYYDVTFRGSERAVITLSGDGSSCLELRVYDENGILVASDTAGFGDDRDVVFTPKWTGPFTIKVTNIGPASNLYTLRTN